MKSMNRTLGAGLAAVVLAFGMQSSKSFALPLLAENAKQTVAGILTLYPDDSDPNLFYFMPNSSEFVTDPKSGLPLFGLTYYGLDSDNKNFPDGAGGLMVFTMKLAMSPDQKAALNAFLATGKSIAVLPVQSSTFGLKVQGNQIPLTELFSEADFPPYAGRAEDEIGGDIVLKGVGAKIMKEAVSESDVLDFQYCYTIQGLSPSFDAHIHVNYSKVYEDFKTRASAGGWFWHADITAEIEKLEQSHDVIIDINHGGGDDATKDEYVEQVADRMIDRMFTPALSNNPTNISPSSSFYSFSMSYTKRSETDTDDWYLTERTLETKEFCTAISLASIAPYVSQLVKDADK